jgi:hypothetical protein
MAQAYDAFNDALDVDTDAPLVTGYYSTLSLLPTSDEEWRIDAERKAMIRTIMIRLQPGGPAPERPDRPNRVRSTTTRHARRGRIRASGGTVTRERPSSSASFGVNKEKSWLFF